MTFVLIISNFPPALWELTRIWLNASGEKPAACGYTDDDLDAVFAPELPGLDRDEIRRCGAGRVVDDLEYGTGGPNDQQRLAAGMLAPGNLLDLVRTFTLFSVNDKDETIKIVGRYQQFRTVKRAVKRLLEGRSPRGRNGIVWIPRGRASP